MESERIKGIKPKRGRPRVSAAVWNLICDEVRHHPEATRKSLAAELESKIKLKGETSPTQLHLIKLITKARNSKSFPEDDAWHLDLFDECPVPADALPVVLQIQKYVDKNLSKRLVKWLTRVYVVLKGRQFLKGNEPFYYLYCYLWASMYADRENVSEISKSLGTPITFSTSDLDAGLLDDNPLSSPLKPFVLNLLSTGVFWLAGADPCVVSNEQKERYSILLAQKIEEALIGHNLGGSESGKHGAGALWLVYVLQIIEAWRRGHITNVSKDEIEALLWQLREKLPELLDVFRQSNHESELYIDTLKSSFEKYQRFWDTLKVKKEGQT